MGRRLTSHVFCRTGWLVSRLPLRGVEKRPPRSCCRCWRLVANPQAGVQSFGCPGEGGRQWRITAAATGFASRPFYLLGSRRSEVVASRATRYGGDKLEHSTGHRMESARFTFSACHKCRRSCAGMISRIVDRRIRITRKKGLGMMTRLMSVAALAMTSWR